MNKKLRFLSALGLAVVVPFLSPAQSCMCFSTGDGSEGAFNATTNTTLAGGVHNFTTFNINSGDTVTVTGTQPLVLHCTGLVSIDGVLIANGGNGSNGITSGGPGIGGVGVAGGANGGDGVYSSSTGPLPGIAGFGPGGAGNQGDAWSGGGGGGYAMPGDSSGNSSGGFGGPAYGFSTISSCTAGSGGGGGSGGYSCGGGGGGAGGGFITINAPTLTVGASGRILCNGGNGGSDGAGNCGGGGGGSGGSIWLAAVTVTVNGMVSAVGGNGGASAVPGNPYYGGGAMGSDGRIRIDYGTINGTGTVTPASGFGTSNTLSPATFSFTTDTVCVATAPFAMNGNPAGGVYTGTAVSGNMFDPSMATAGVYNFVSYTYDDSVGCTLSITDSIYVDVCTGIQSADRDPFHFLASPNPNNGNFLLTFSGLPATATVRLYNGIGQEVQGWTVQSPSATITVNDLAPGIYLVTAESGTSRLARRVIVK